MAIDMFKLKAIAKSRFKSTIQSEEDLISFLAVWWSQKYNLPDNHPLFLDKTLEEHVIDYYIDEFYKNPKEANAPSEEELAADDARLKEEYGDDFTEDFFVAPTSEELKGGSPEKSLSKLEEEFDDNFTDED